MRIMHATILSVVLVGGRSLRLVAQNPTRPARVVDSIFPVDEEIRRFKATVRERPAALRGGARTRDELVHRFVRAVERRDRRILATLVLDRAEFAYLYFPTTRYTRPPYRQKPGLVWFQMTAMTDRGINRLLKRDGGKPLGVTGYRCAEPTLEGNNVIFTDCLVEVMRGGVTAQRKFFGSILERDGMFKFLTYSSD